MKKNLIIFLVLASAYAIIGCNTSTKDATAAVTTAVPQAMSDTTKPVKKVQTFYVICSHHTGGWCSAVYNNYDDAKAALASHKKSTGHTDNSVSNDCPFGSLNTY